MLCWVDEKAKQSERKRSGVLMHMNTWCDFCYLTMQVIWFGLLFWFVVAQRMVVTKREGKGYIICYYLWENFEDNYHWLLVLDMLQC